MTIFWSSSMERTNEKGILNMNFVLSGHVFKLSKKNSETAIVIDFLNVDSKGRGKKKTVKKRPG